MKKFATTSGAAPVLHRNTANLMQSMLDEVKASIVILPELLSLIPSLQNSEFKQLEANIRKDGCRESLLIWQTTQGVIEDSGNGQPVNVLVDGHNRFLICTENNIDFRVILREFPTIQAVRDFMIDNQLGRRNLTPEQTSYLRGLKYRNERQAAGRPIQGENTVEQERLESEKGQRTQDRLAKEFNVSPRTIHRDREYSEGIDKLTPELKQEVLKGKQKVSKDLIRAIGKNNETDTIPISLPELLALNELPLPSKTNELTPDNSKILYIVNKIVKLATGLNPNSPKFETACDRIIALSNEAKRLSSV